MVLNRAFLRNNISTISILLFFAIYSIIIYLRPGFLYNNDGSLRQFGLNNNKKTIIPIWLLVILIAIISYFIMLYYLALPKFML